MLASAKVQDRPLDRYLSLSPDRQAVLQVKALSGDINKSSLIPRMNEAGFRDRQGRPWTMSTFNPILDELRGMGLLGADDQCPPGLRHAIAVDAMARPEGERFARALHNLPPNAKSPPIPPHKDSALLRKLFLSIYINDGDQFAKSLDRYTISQIENDRTGYSGQHLFRDLYLDTVIGVDWFKSRHLNIRYEILSFKVNYLMVYGHVAPDLADLVALCRDDRDQSDDDHFQDLLLSVNMLSGRLADVRQVITTATKETDYVILGLEASIAFLEGRNEDAIAKFRESLKRYRKSIGRRKPFLIGTGGLFFLLALLKAGDATFYAEVQSGIEAVRQSNTIYGHGFDAIQGLLFVMQGQEARAKTVLANLRKAKPKEPLGAALLVLAEYFLDPALARYHVEDTIQAYKTYRDVLPLVATIHAQVLEVVADRTGPWDDFLESHGAGEAVLRFTELVKVGQPWERAFDSLAAVLRTSPTRRPTAAGEKKSKRLVWFLDPETNAIEPLEQSLRGKDGWTAGRAVAMKRLYEQDPKLDYLTDHDRRVLKTIHKLNDWYSVVDYAFDPYQSLLALIGHPTVFHAQNRDRRLELVAYPAELVVTEKRGGFAVALSHTADAPAVFLEAETPDRYRVIDVSAKVLAVQEVLGKSGLTVPRQGKERLLELLKDENLNLPVRADIADADLPTTAGDPTPVLQLLPWEDGLKATMVVRPFAPQGPIYVAGVGGQSVLAVIGGERLRANRDLETEKAAAARVRTTLKTLDLAETDGHGWTLPTAETALEFLLEVQACPHPVKVEWPDGEKLRVTPAVSAANLSLRLNETRDWFQVEGAVEVDEDLVLDLKDLLSRLDKAKGRFVPLADGRFVALTQRFQAQLERFGTVTEDDRKGRRLSAFGTVAVQDLVEEAGKVTADQAWSRLLDRLAAAERYDPVLPATLQAELRDYQLEGFRWLSRLAHWGAGACLADDMGLGKTVQAIAVLLQQAPQGPCLVVAPTSVCHNWEQEISRFAPALTVERLGTGADRSAQIAGLKPMTVLIASYTLVHQEIERLAAVTWRMAVFDEAQAVKNAETRRSQACQQIAADFRLALTGTPVENSLDELWSLFNLINPGLLGSAESFRRRFAGPIERNRNDAALKSLRSLIRPFLLRRTKSAVLSELPPRTELTLAVDPPEEEKAFLEALRQKALETLSNTGGVPPGQRRIHILAEITKLRRACCHPGLIDPATTLPGAKLSTFLELVDDLVRSNHRALVFSQFVGHLERVAAALDQQGIRYQYLDGSTPAKDRAQRVNAFQAGDGALFLISLKAGGTGLNLTAADYVIHLDPWWNPAVEDQASDRAHRIGQQRPVTIYRLIVRDSIEQKILDLHRHKRDLAGDLLEGSEMSGRLSEDELLDLIRV